MVKPLYWAWFLLAAMLAGCQSAPLDTMNKRLYAVEASYSSVLELAILYQQEGRLTKEDQQNLADAFTEYTSLRNVAVAALTAGDFKLAEDTLTAMTQIIDIARPIVAKGAQ
jgi:hypothetical protein